MDHPHVIAVWLGNLKKRKRGEIGLCAIDVIEGEGWHSLVIKGYCKSKHLLSIFLYIQKKKGRDRESAPEPAASSSHK